MKLFRVKNDAEIEINLTTEEEREVCENYLVSEIAEICEHHILTTKGKILEKDEYMEIARIALDDIRENDAMAWEIITEAADRYLKKDKDNWYLVIRRIEREDCGGKMMKPAEIFNMMSMSDCYDIDIDVYRIRPFGKEPEKCIFHGTWHDASDPLKMTITSEDGKIYEVGYGTDH